MKKYLLFDYDGTLHDCAKLYVPAFRQVCNRLVLQGLIEEKQYTDKEIEAWLGFSPKEMWETFQPNLSDFHRKTASKQIEEIMSYETQNGNARLFPDVLDTLSILKEQGYRAIFLSNCQHSYMELHKKIFGLEKYFDGFYCGEDFDYRPKHEIFNTIYKDFPGEYVVIGDRFHDIEIAKVHSLPSVGCLYGYSKENELDIASLTINQFSELPSALKSEGLIH